MKNFIIYDSNGTIKRTGNCSDIDFELQARVGEFLLEGEANDALQLIINGKVVNKPLTPPSSFNIEDARITKAFEITGNCESFITAGFISNALGTNYAYPSNRDDQLNLSGTIQRSMMSAVTVSDTFAFLCKNSSDVWDYRLHTANQIQQVGVDAYNYILNARIKNATLQTQLQAATTQAALEAVMW